MADASDESSGDSERDDPARAGEDFRFVAVSGAFPDRERPDFKCSATELSVAGWLGQQYKSL